MSNSTNTGHILLVEDTLSYQELMTVAFEENQIEHQLHIVDDVESALKFIEKDPPYQWAPRPDLIFLDIHLPKIDGYELLVNVKNNLKFKTIPIIILTSSQQQQDILKSYNLKANCYLHKPYQLSELINLVKVSIHFWLNCSQLAQT